MGHYLPEIVFSSKWPAVYLVLDMLASHNCEPCHEFGHIRPKIARYFDKKKKRFSFVVWLICLWSDLFWSVTFCRKVRLGITAIWKNHAVLAHANWKFVCLISLQTRQMSISCCHIMERAVPSWNKLSQRCFPLLTWLNHWL